jgi:hypothetical protein
MATPKIKKTPAAIRRRNSGTGYRGRQTKTGNSLGFRFEGALFRSHPEFNGEVTAHVIAPGRMLVTAEPEYREDEEDPVLASFLAFLAKEIEENPVRIRPLDAKLVKRAARLTKGIKVNLDEDLGEESLLQ